MSFFFSFAQLRGLPGERELLCGLLRHGEAYRDHALVWRLFPGDGLSRDFIFRRVGRDRGRPDFYIVSHRPPDTKSDLFQVQTKPYQPQLAAGQAVRFDLRANPTVSRRLAGVASHRHDVVMDAKRELRLRGVTRDVVENAGKNWLLERAHKWGLRVQGESVLQTNYRQHCLVRKGVTIRFSSLDFRAIAEVAEPELLHSALLDGVGHCKGFGCGMLLVRR